MVGNAKADCLGSGVVVLVAFGIFFDDELAELFSGVGGCLASNS